MHLYLCQMKCCFSSIYLPAFLAQPDLATLNSPVLQVEWQLLEDPLNTSEIFIWLGRSSSLLPFGLRSDLMA